MAPIQSYSGKAQVFKRYKDAFDTPFYKSLTKQLPVLVNLYDLIERELSLKYTDYKKKLGVAIPRFGSVKGVENIEKGTKTNYLQKKTTYSISSGYIYPIFGAFRSLLRFDEESGEVSWLFDPLEIWNEVGTSIAQNTWSLRQAYKNSYKLKYYDRWWRQSSSEKYALRGFKKGKGNCYVMAATFYIQAKLLGYNVHQVRGKVAHRAPHSWTVIKHGKKYYVYDPNFRNETGGNGWKIWYGKRGTWRYTNYHKMN